MARIRAAILATAGLVGAFAATSALAGQTTFTDTTFNNGDYTLGVFKDASVSVTSYGHSDTAGNPGGALQALATSTGADAQGMVFTALNNGFVYDPTANGAVTSIDASLDRFSNPTNGGVGSNVGSYSLRVLAQQDGTLYQATFVFGPNNQPGGDFHLLTENGIAASDFTTLTAANFTGSGVTGLDFGGDAITFGFAMRSSGAVNSDGALSTFDQTNDLRADNFSLTVNSAAAVPEPAGWALMIVGFGAVGGLARARRKLATA